MKQQPVRRKPSAKRGQQIAELRSAIEAAIDWQQLPVVNSIELFQSIKIFLSDQGYKCFNIPKSMQGP